MNDDELDKEHPDFNKIRHFKADWKDYIDFWEKKGARMTPFSEWEQEYPEKKKMKSDPVHLYKTFDDESKVKESTDGPDLANINVKKLSKNSLTMKVGDQVLWRGHQELGVGTLNMFHPDGTANVQFYETLDGSAFGKKGDDYRIKTSELFTVDALDDSYQFNESKSVEQSAGFAIVYNGKVLLAHSVGRPKYTGYGIPKGHLDGDESVLQAALRETQEEVGITIPTKLIPSSYRTCPYMHNKKGHWKDVHYFTIIIESLGEIGLKDEVVPKSQLQAAEVDWAGFIPLKKARKVTSSVMKPIIDSLMVYESQEFMTFEQFKEDINEDNLTALAGSQEDRIPMPKPFVVKSKKPRKGSNEDEDDETQEVANMNTTGLGNQ